VTLGLKGPTAVDLSQPSGRLGLQPVDPAAAFHIPVEDLTIRQPHRIIHHRFVAGESSHHHELLSNNYLKYPPPV
jgi:hypothetical protein